MFNEACCVIAGLLIMYSIPSSLIGLAGVLSCNRYADASVINCGIQRPNTNFFDLSYENTTCHFTSEVIPCMHDNQVIRICYRLSNPSACQSSVTSDGSGAVMFSNPNIPYSLLLSGILSVTVSICMMMCLYLYRRSEIHFDKSKRLMHPSLVPYYSIV